MTIPKYNEIYNDVLYVLSDGKEHNHHEIADTVAYNINLSKEDKLEKHPKSGVLVYKDRIGWARFYLKSAGLVESRRRNYSNITKEGLRVFNSGVFIDNDYLNKYDSFRDFRQRKHKPKKNKKQSDTLMVICANCGKENIKGSKFCGYCGSKIDENKIYCPVCKTKHDKKFTYCNECGSKLVTYTQLSEIKNKTNSKSISKLKSQMYSISKNKEVLNILRDEINKKNINSLEELKEKGNELENKFRTQKELLNYLHELTNNEYLINNLTKQIKNNIIKSKEEIKNYINKQNISSPKIELIEYLLKVTNRKDIQQKIIPKIKYGNLTTHGQINAEINKLKKL